LLGHFIFLNDLPTTQKTLDGKHGITYRSNIFGGRAVAIGIDLGAYIGEANGGKTRGIPRSYVAQVQIQMHIQIN